MSLYIYGKCPQYHAHCTRLLRHVNRFPRHVNKLPIHDNSPPIHDKRLQDTLRGLLNMVRVSKDIVTGSQYIVKCSQDMSTGYQDKLTALRHVHILSLHDKRPHMIVIPSYTNVASVSKHAMLEHFSHVT
jgi:hypothetical protein